MHVLASCEFSNGIFIIGRLMDLHDEKNRWAVSDLVLDIVETLCIMGYSGYGGASLVSLIGLSMCLKDGRIWNGRVRGIGLPKMSSQVENCILERYGFLRAIS